MTFAEGALRFVLGGALVLLIGIIAKNGKASLAGIIALFPIVTAVSFYFMAKSLDEKIVKEAALSSILSFPATLAFLITFYICVDKFSIIKTIAFSIFAWLIAAAIFYFIKIK